MQLSLVALSTNSNAVSVFGASPLFDPRSCYHPALPLVLRRDGGVTIKESESGGTLMSIRLDDDRDVVDQGDRVAQPVRVDLRERYHREAGVPRVAAVLDVEPPTRKG